MLGDLLLAAADDGAAVLFSSHQLDLVQHLCQDIVTIDHGRVVLAGSLEELQAEARSRHVDVVSTRPPARDWCADLPGARVSGSDDRHLRVAVSDSSDPAAVLQAAQAAGPLLSFTFQPPSLEERPRRLTPPGPYSHPYMLTVDDAVIHILNDRAQQALDHRHHPGL